MKRKILLAFLALISVAAIGVSTAFADEFDLDGINSNSEYVDKGYLIVTPNRLRFDGILEPGNIYTTSFRAINIGGKPLTFNLTIEPYGVRSENYDPVYSEPTNRTKITDWITILGDTEFTLEPQAGRHRCDDCSVEIIVRVNVPANAVGGSQYAAIMANIIPTEPSTSSISALARIALALHATINGGDLEYSGTLLDRRISAFSFKPVIRTSSSVKNDGNADFVASYHLLIKSFFGDRTAYDKTEDKIIYPDTIRFSEQNWDEAPALGIFNVTQEITYINENGEQVTDTFRRVTIICPLWLIAILIAILTVLTIAIIFRKQHHKTGHKKPSWEQG